MKYGSVGWMLVRLDAEAIDERRRKNSKRFIRRLESNVLKAFAHALKYEMLHDHECHEWNIRKKVCNRLGIKAREYRLLRYRCLKAAISGSKIAETPAR